MYCEKSCESTTLILSLPQGLPIIYHTQACLFKAKYLQNALSALNKAGFRALFRRTSLASFLFGTVTLTGEATKLKTKNYFFVNKAMLECLL